MELKDWESYGNLVYILEDKGVIITDRMAVVRFLNEVNFYRFIGYLIPFGIRRHKGTSIQFEKVRRVYEFDEKLRNLITGVLDVIENYLKSQLGHYHGKHFGAEGYLDAANFNKRHNGRIFKDRVSRCISDNRKTMIVIHHQEVYDGHFPIWVIIEFFSMGMLSYFYSDMKNKDKTVIALSMYGINYQIMESWLHSVTVLRNKCAHFTRLYGWTFSSVPRLPLTEEYVPDRTLFTQLLMLMYMYPDHERWNGEVKPALEAIMNDYDAYIDYRHIGFPARWRSVLAY